MKKGWNNPFAMIYLVSEKPDGTPVDIDKTFEESGLAGALGGKR